MKLSKQEIKVKDRVAFDVRLNGVTTTYEGIVAKIGPRVAEVMSAGRRLTIYISQLRRA
jgi:hypothetical protein